LLKGGHFTHALVFGQPPSEGFYMKQLLLYNPLPTSKVAFFMLAVPGYIVLYYRLW